MTVMDTIMTHPALPPPHDPSASPPPPPPPPGPSIPHEARALPRRLYRDPTGPLGGVASGMAGYFGVDPVLVRLLWLVALFSGIGFFAYLVFWMIVPKARTWPPAGYPSGGEAREGGLGVSNAMISGLLIVALAAVLGSHWDGLFDLVLPVTLVGFGVYLLNQRAQAHSQSRIASPEPAVAGVSTEPGVPLAADVQAAAREEDGPVTRIVLSVLALWLGIAWALTSYGVPSLSLMTTAAVALVIVGGGLIASLWFGRARGLVPLGIVLGSVLLIASAVEGRPISFHTLIDSDKQTSRDGVGQHVFTPSSLAELEDRYEVDMGELTLDLSGLELAGSTERVHVEVGMGKATVIVPADVAVEVHSEVGMGKTQAFDLVSEGLGRELSTTQPGSTPGQLIIELEVGVGEGTVRRD
jgi:phage shock protein PspC (stress-responsive transcriptional regulator)